MKSSLPARSGARVIRLTISGWPSPSKSPTNGMLRLETIVFDDQAFTTPQVMDSTSVTQSASSILSGSTTCACEITHANKHSIPIVSRFIILTQLFPITNKHHFCCKKLHLSYHRLTIDLP